MTIETTTADQPEGTLWRKVRMSDALFQAITSGGRVEWGEPDADGFYNPVVFVQHPTIDPDRLHRTFAALTFVVVVSDGRGVPPAFDHNVWQAIAHTYEVTP